MLRVECKHDGNGTLAVRLEGRLVGAFAEDARITLARYRTPLSIAVDLAEVTFVDSFGEQVLLWLGRLGARFVAANVYTRSVCERLRLEISDEQSGSASGTDAQAIT